MNDSVTSTGGTFLYLLVLMTLWEEDSGQNHKIKIGVEQLKCLGTILTFRNYIHIKKLRAD